MNEIKKDKLQDSLLDNFHIIVDLPQSNRETEKLIKSLSQDSGFPKKKIPPIQFEKSLEGPIDATLLKDHIINQVGSVEITQSNIEDIIRLGALKNGFFNVKDSLIHEMSDLILEDLGIKKERKKVDIRKKV